jgi:hypothetical protein
MVEKFPQHDLRPDLRGGADAWDNGPGGLILTADYFDSPPPALIVGSLVATLANATLVATGTIPSTGVSGSVTATLGPATVVSAARLRVAGQATATLAPATLVTQATLRIAGSLSTPLSPLLAVGAAGLRVAGSVTATLGGATLAASGAVASGPVTGQLAATLDGAILSASATHGKEAPKGGGPALRGSAPIVIIRRAVQDAEAALDGDDKALALVQAVDALEPVAEGEWMASRLAALRLRAERIAREERDREAWQQGLSIASALIEIRVVMMALRASLTDDEDAITALLLA